jgi:Sulfotransferase domain.
MIALPTRVATGQLPNLLIIGSQKAGTTSLHTYLSYHPEIFMSKNKELAFFCGTNSDKDTDWYRSNFKTDKAIRGESSMVYTHCKRYPGVPARIHELIPEAKLIYILRDPISRVLSHYSHFKPTIEKATV